ncbi:serine/threonine-protein kinase [Pseudonocardia sp.]|uniref:serine/threonine-protein kinase n=1 Tax=Pseudonocardia sp. TaxID=60912 RepID=UPI003D15260B
MGGAAFGPYRLQRLLGKGGMGEVHVAYDTVTARTVALKLLRPHLAHEQSYVARFRRECRVAARLSEAHVLPIHGFGEIDGVLYLDMRLVAGMDLAAWIRRYGPLPPQAAAVVTGQVAQALDAAHAQGLVHRDVKPSNILLADVTGPPLDPAGLFAYLLDFGIARPRSGTPGPDGVVLTKQGAVPGSPCYVAPERYSHVEGQPAADVYSLACVLFEMLVGRPPFTGNPAVLMRAHLLDPPPRPSTARPGTPAAFDAVVARGMAKDPRLRQRTAGELAAAARAAVGTDLEHLRTVRADSTLAAVATVPHPSARIPSGRAQAEPTPPRPAARRRRRRGATSTRRRFATAIGTGLVTALAAAALLAFAYLRDPTPLQVAGASVAATEPGRACDVTVDVVGSVRTNGRAGEITYTWSRSDGETTAMLTEPVAAGQTSVDVHLLWTLTGRGRHDATATLRVIEPTPTEAAGSFTYDCP